VHPATGPPVTSCLRAPEETPMPKAGHARPDASAAEVLGPVLRHQVLDLRSWESGVRLDRREAVHRYRIATRRLRSHLAGFRSLLDADACDELARDLRRASAVVSGARDAEIVRRRVEALLKDESDPAIDATRERLERLVSQAYDRGLRDSVNHLDTPDYDTFTRRLERFADLPPWLSVADRPAEEVFRPLVRHEWKRFRSRGIAAVASCSGPRRDDRLHDARKAAKRARHVSETLAPVFGRRAKRLAKAAERVQLVLGEHQDCAMTQAMLGTAGEEAYRDGDNSFVLGRMQAREAATAEELRETFVRLYFAADRKQLRRWLR
jgi:CHAD domain-containing protein